MAIFGLWGGSLLLKLWQHFLFKKRKVFGITHTFKSYRYSLCIYICLAFTNPIGIVWWSKLAIALPDFKTWRFFWSCVNIGIFSSEVPHPELGNCTDSLLSLSGLELVPCFSNFVRIWTHKQFIFTHLYVPALVVFNPFPASPWQLSWNLSSEFFNPLAFLPRREVSGIPFSVRNIKALAIALNHLCFLLKAYFQLVFV